MRRNTSRKNRVRQRDEPEVGIPVVHSGGEEIICILSQKFSASQSKLEMCSADRKDISGHPGERYHCATVSIFWRIWTQADEPKWPSCSSPVKNMSCFSFNLLHNWRTNYFVMARLSSFRRVAWSFWDRAYVGKVRRRETVTQTKKRARSNLRLSHERSSWVHAAPRPRSVCPRRLSLQAPRVSGGWKTLEQRRPHRYRWRQVPDRPATVPYA